MSGIPKDFQEAELAGALPIDPETGQLGIVLISGSGTRLRVTLQPKDVLLLKDALDGFQTGELNRTNCQSEKSSGKSRSAGHTPLDGMKVLPPTSSSSAIKGD